MKTLFRNVSIAIVLATSGMVYANDTYKLTVENSDYYRMFNSFIIDGCDVSVEIYNENTINITPETCSISDISNKAKKANMDTDAYILSVMDEILTDLSTNVEEDVFEEDEEESSTDTRTTNIYELLYDDAIMQQVADVFKDHGIKMDDKYTVNMKSIMGIKGIGLAEPKTLDSGSRTLTWKEALSLGAHYLLPHGCVKGRESEHGCYFMTNYRYTKDPATVQYTTLGADGRFCVIARIKANVYWSNCRITQLVDEMNKRNYDIEHFLDVSFMKDRVTGVVLQRNGRFPLSQIANLGGRTFLYKSKQHATVTDTDGMRDHNSAIINTQDKYLPYYLADSSILHIGGTCKNGIGKSDCYFFMNPDVFMKYHRSVGMGITIGLFDDDSGTFKECSIDRIAAKAFYTSCDFIKLNDNLFRNGILLEDWMLAVFGNLN